MNINNTKINLWKDDIRRSVDFYNEWFINFAPRAFRETRIATTLQVNDALMHTNQLRNISGIFLEEHPETLTILRMCTCPPIARDRLIGLADINGNLVKKMEDPENPGIPPRMKKELLVQQLGQVSQVISDLLDYDIFEWLKEERNASDEELYRASTVVADRLCGSMANPIIRNAQESRQLEKLVSFFEANDFAKSASNKFDELEPGTYAIHINVPVTNAQGNTINVSVDFAFVPINGKRGKLPVLVEAKSAGDYTNVNKRRKEEAAKMQQLKNSYQDDDNLVEYVLFLNGYFDSGYLGYEAAEGIDWVWEHRLEDMRALIH